MYSNNCNIVALSDLHGILPEIKDPFDIMLLAGDLVDLYYQKNTIFTKNWYSNDFVKWINELPFKDDNSVVIWIAGNHEVGFQNLSENDRNELIRDISIKTHNKAIYLQDELFITHDIFIYGTPWCHQFGNWAYMKSDEELIKIYEQIPYYVDILLTHDAPYGTSDICYGNSSYTGSLEHLGNIPLQKAIIEKRPKINIHGHLHSSNHNCELLNDTQVYCVSLVNEAYNQAYSPLCLKY